MIRRTWAHNLQSILLLSTSSSLSFQKSFSVSSPLRSFVQETSYTTTTSTTATDPLKTYHRSSIQLAMAQPESTTTTTTTVATCDADSNPKGVWIPNDPKQAHIAKELLEVWPLDEANAILLNEVHPYEYTKSTATPHEVYDLIAIGAGAGGLVSAKQSARRGAKSAMISEKLAGGDCLNIGCVPSKALLHAAKTINTIRIGQSKYMTGFGDAGTVDFPAIMSRMRILRAKISPADGHPATEGTGSHVYQGRGIFTGKDTIQVIRKNADGTEVIADLKFKKAVIATGGRPTVPTTIPGLLEAPYTTNESLFNLEVLPPRMVILGSGFVSLEMAYCFATFGSQVTIIQRTERLFQSKYGDIEGTKILQESLEALGVVFLSESKVQEVKTVREFNEENTKELPLMEVTIETTKSDKKIKQILECECLIVATGRAPNIENLGLEEAGVEYKEGAGIVVNDLAQSVSNPNVYAVGDCVADMPRLTHVAGEMAKLVIQNSLFNDNWLLSSLVIPAVMYTDPEYATVGISSQEMADTNGIEVDVYRASLHHNDRAILEDNNIGFCLIICKKDTDTILGSTIVAERAGEMINEITLAMKNNIGLRAIGRNIHSYPTIGEAVMTCGIQYINSRWQRLN